MGPQPQKSVTRYVSYTIVRMKIWLYGEATTAIFLTPEDGDIGFTQKSNKRLQKYMFSQSRPRQNNSSVH
jgi:hypothetical protein